MSSERTQSQSNRLTHTIEITKTPYTEISTFNHTKKEDEKSEKTKRNEDSRHSLSNIEEWIDWLIITRKTPFILNIATIDLGFGLTVQSDRRFHYSISN